MNGMMLFQQGLFLTAVAFTIGEVIEPTKHDLVRYLLEGSGYDKRFPPDTENVTDVSVQLHITDMDSESDRNMEIELTLNLRMNWTDRRLDFSGNKTTYDVINLGDNIVDNVWIPDLYFIHERKSELHGLFSKNQLVFIHQNGQVLYSGRFNIKTECNMTFTKYPYDIQHCPIEIQSYAFSTKNIQLQWNGEDAVQIDPTISLLLSKHPAYTNESRYTYQNIGEYSTLTTEISFKRPKGSYVITIIAPPIIVVLIAFMTFFLDKNVTTRITIPTGGLTQLFVQWAGVYNMLSLDSTPEYLDAWMLGNITFVGFILFQNVMICHYKYIETDDKLKNKDLNSGKKKKKKTSKQTTDQSNTAYENGYLLQNFTDSSDQENKLGQENWTSRNSLWKLLKGWIFSKMTINKVAFVLTTCLYILFGTVNWLVWK